MESWLFNLIKLIFEVPVQRVPVQCVKHKSCLLDFSHLMVVATTSEGVAKLQRSYSSFQQSSYKRPHFVKQLWCAYIRKLNGHTAKGVELARSRTRVQPSLSAFYLTNHTCMCLYRRGRSRTPSCSLRLALHVKFFSVTESIDRSLIVFPTLHPKDRECQTSRRTTGFAPRHNRRSASSQSGSTSILHP